MVETGLARIRLFSRELQSSMTRPQPESKLSFLWLKVLSGLPYKQKENLLQPPPRVCTHTPVGWFVHCINVHHASLWSVVLVIQWSTKVKILALYPQSQFRPLTGILILLSVSLCLSHFSGQTLGNLPDQEECAQSPMPLRANRYCSCWLSGLKLTSLAFQSPITWQANCIWN